MAKFEVVKIIDEDLPPSVECIEVLIWGAAGTARQGFEIGSGGGFNASIYFWLEIRYSLQGIPLFYTRNAIANIEGFETEMMETRLEKFLNKETSVYFFAEWLPETSIELRRNSHSYTPLNGEVQTSYSYTLQVSADTGAVFGQDAPGLRSVDIIFNLDEVEEGLPFMREVIQEIVAAKEGRHPDPGSLPPGFSDWPFARELNRRAYDRISDGYNEKYFENPLLSQTFEDWMGLLPACGHVLDAGCGHGKPVIDRLLERGLVVTGSDLSPRMLAQACAQFPQITFLEKAISELKTDTIFDGVCSFSSMLYLDTIDFFHAIYHLYQVLKPGGLLFLYGYDLHPGWRGRPYDLTIHEWMWGGTRGIEETTAALEEHGYFKVLRAENTMTEEEKLEAIENWREREMREHEKFAEEFHASIDPPDLSTPPENLPYSYVIIAQRQER